MRVSDATLTFFLVLPLVLVKLASAAARSDGFAQLRQTPASEQELHEVLMSVRSELRQDPHRIADLLLLVNDSTVNDKVRWELVGLLLEHPEDFALKGLLRHAAESVTHGDLETQEQMRVVHILTGLATHPALKLMHDDPDLISMLRWAARNEYTAPENCAQRWDLIAAAPVDDRSRVN